MRNSDGHLRGPAHYCGTTGEPVLLRRPRGFTSGKPGNPIGPPKISWRLIGRLAVTWTYLADTFDSCALPPSSSLGEQRDAWGSLGSRLQLKCQTPVTRRCVWRRGDRAGPGRDKCSAFLR